MKSCKILKSSEGGRMKDKKMKQNKHNEQKTVTNMGGIKPTITIIPLNMNGLNTSTKRDC